MKIKYLTYEEAKKLLSNFSIKSSIFWYKNKKNMPELSLIPSAPNKFYKNNGWVSWMDFLGNTRPYVTCKVSYNEARDFARNINLKGMNEWRDYCSLNLLPKNMTTNPHFIYKGKGWTSWGDFLGTNHISFKERYKRYYSYEDAKTYMIQFNLKNKNDFYLFFKNNVRPWFIPIAPELFYKREKVWISWEDFLIGGKKIIPFNEFKNYIKELGIKSKKEYSEFIKNSYNKI